MGKIELPRGDKARRLSQRHQKLSPEALDALRDIIILAGPAMQVIALEGQTDALFDRSKAVQHRVYADCKPI